MDDFMKKAHSNVRDMTGSSKHHKVSYSGKHAASSPYEASEMKRAMNCSQDGLGIGKGHPVHAKMPIYDVFGKVLSVTNGHHDVKGGKI